MRSFLRSELVGFALLASWIGTMVLFATVFSLGPDGWFLLVFVGFWGLVVLGVVLGEGE